MSLEKIVQINSPTGGCNTGYTIQFIYDNNVYYYAGLEDRLDGSKYATSTDINIAALYQFEETAHDFANKLIYRLIKGKDYTLGGKSFYGKQDELSYEIIEVMEIIKREVKIMKAQKIPYASERRAMLNESE